nr:PREDICTED: uncharacterized protein LOC105680080 [Linepithema humile]
MDILDIADEPVNDERIVKYEMHTYNPYANTTLGHSDEIRIPIQQQDLYTLPCESFLYIEGKLVTPADENRDNVCIIGNNCVAFMFDEMRYELDGVEIDRNRNVGITSTIKNYISLTTEKSKMLKHASWNPNGYPLIDGNFNFCVPLNTLLGFCEDYKRIVINVRHELVLKRSRNDNNCLVGRVGTNPTIELLKMQWRMPHDLYKFSLLQNTTKHSWAVKAATQLEKPRYVIFALQTGRKNVLSENAAEFDACKLTNKSIRYTVLMYARFRKAYYGFDNTYLDIDDFLKAGPFVVIDCSRQNDSVKSATVDVRIEFDCKENIPANTTAYCLIIHDRMVEYNPLNNIVRRLV